MGGVAGMNNNTITCERDESSPSSNNAASAQATQEMANCFGLYSNLQTEISYAYGSDYVPFENNGEIITGLYESNESPYTHSPNDTMDNMDPNYVYEVTKGALGSALHFAVAREQLGVSENLFTENIVIYPNPSNGKISINLNASSEADIEFTLYNVLGKEVYATFLKGNTNLLDLTFVQSGIYYGVFMNGKTVATKKIVLR